MLAKILKLFVTINNQVIMIFRDLKMTFKLPVIQDKIENQITYRGMYRSELSSISKFYTLMNPKAKLSLARKVVYWLVGDKLVVVVSKVVGNKTEIIGLNMFYFNRQDVDQNTIHDGFIGVDVSQQGLGIGSKLRRNGVEHFRKTYLSGISSRIDTNNKASLAITLKSGFKPVEQYKDPVTGVERYYLINWF